MAELRWNPMIRDWVMVASNRQNRPNMPKDFCPFCPPKDDEEAKLKPGIPKEYDVFKYDNDFPALSQNPPEMDHPYAPDSKVYKVAPSHGKCEVILYSSDHDGKFYDLSDEHTRKLVDLWVERFNDLSSDPDIKYIFIFENKFGTTQPHPHGQIYGYPFVPKKIELELDSMKEEHDADGTCLFCRINREESDFGQRLICENDSFVAYIPFFADYVYGIYISSKVHRSNITEFTADERNDLGIILKQIIGMYESLFPERKESFPYMMCMHNAPVNLNGPEYEKYAGYADYFHFHIELYPTLRAADKEQFMASSETGCWAHCNPTAPEEKAQEMREALERFLNK